MSDFAHFMERATKAEKTVAEYAGKFGEIVSAAQALEPELVAAEPALEALVKLIQAHAAPPAA